MSGGHFDYWQYHISHIAEEVKDVVVKNHVETPAREHERWDYDENGNLYPWAKYHYDYTPETIEKFKEGYKKLREAYIYAQRIDWLLSGDDSEESFHKRLKEDFNDLKNELSNERWEYKPEEDD